MTHEEIMQRAIEKAERNGLDAWTTELSKIRVRQHHYREFLFDHEFARAFFGEHKINILIRKHSPVEGLAYEWQYHLKQMVISEDPVKYLENYL